MNNASEISLKCARLILSTLVMTQEKDKNKLIAMSKNMYDLALSSPDYSVEDKEVYHKVYRFFKACWKDDFNEILDIVFNASK